MEYKGASIYLLFMIFADRKLCRTFNNRTKLDFTHHNERVRQSSRWPRPPWCHADNLAPHDALDDCITEKKEKTFSVHFTIISLIRRYYL